jgi:hypothetical protein
MYAGWLDEWILKWMDRIQEDGFDYEEKTKKLTNSFRKIEMASCRSLSHTDVYHFVDHFSLLTPVFVDSLLLATAS